MTLKPYILACFIAASCSIIVEAALNEYRISDNIIPNDYEIHLKLTNESLTTSNYSGEVTIGFKLKTTSKTIELHSGNDITIEQISLSKNGVNETVSYNNTSSSRTEILIVTASADLTAETEYYLNIQFAAKLQTDSMYGFYLSHYTEDGANKSLATTQFEAPYARRAFPCFDEPAYKATFIMTISAPDNYNILFNTPEETQSAVNGIRTVKFKKTPVMPTYLLAFIVSEFTCTDSENKIDDDILHSVCSRNSTAAERDIALLDSPKLMNELTKLLNISYKSHNFEKMHQVAIPDFSAGAMENWGLVTYREVLLLNGNDTTNLQKQRISTVIAHEFTHQWFGNLVTMKWWNDIWLNEGFATYYEYHITDKVQTDWELLKQFVVDDQQPVFQTDALISAQPLSSLESDIYTQTNISEKFDSITYSKGGSVLRMINRILGEENFNAALNDYLTKHANGNTAAQDLINAFEARAPQTVKRVASFATIINNWIYKPGFPIVQLTSEQNGDQIHITFTQSRFLLSEQSDSSTWYVPLTYTTKLENNFETVTPKAWLTERSDASVTINTTEEWIIVNIQSSGYYRVNYDSNLWNRIDNALKSNNFSGIPSLNRAQLVDDVLNLARIGKVPYTTAFNLVSYLKNDSDYYAWKSALTGLSYLSKRTSATELGDAISKYILEHLETLYNSVSFDNNETDQIYTLKQVLALTWACRLGKDTCVNNATEEFQKIKRGEDINVNLRSVVYCNGLLYSNSSKDDWAALWDKYTSATSSAEETTIRTALGCMNDAELLKSYLDKSIDEQSGIRRQDALSVFSAVIAGTPNGVNVAFEFLKTNYVKMQDYYKGLNALQSVISSIASSFTTESQLTELENFIGTPGLDDDFKNSANTALETARSNIAWVQKYSSELNGFFGITTGGSTRTSLTFSLLLSTFIVLIKLY